MKSNIQNKIFDFLEKVEKEVPVSSWEFNNEKIWPLLRSTLAYDLVLVEDFNEQDNQVKKYKPIVNKTWIILKTSIAFFKNFLKDFSKNDFNDGKTDVLYLINSSTRFFKIENKWYNPYADTFYPIVEKAGQHQRIVELTSDYQFKIPRFRSSRLIQFRFFLLQFKALMQAKKNPVDFSLFTGMDTLESTLKHYFPEYKGASRNLLSLRLHIYKQYKGYYLQKLKKWKPQVVICHGFYSPDVFSVISASHDLKIKTIEIQHGVQGNYHIAYSRWLSIPKEGYSLFPDVFWTWSDAEKLNIELWANATKKHRVVAGGNPCMFILDKDGNDYSSKISQEIESFLTTNPAEKNIVFTLQAFFNLPDFLIQVVKTNPQWNWWFRVHPQYLETKSALKEVFKEMDHVIIEQAMNYPLKELLHFMDLHITEFSSSVIEAYSMGVSSIVISDRGVNLYSELINEGKVVFANTGELLTAAIKSIGHQDKGKIKLDFQNFENSVRDEIVSIASN